MLGSSFAVPLITGAISLINNTNDVPHLLKAVQEGANAEFLHHALGDSSPPEHVEMVKTIYSKALSHLPHIHKGFQNGSPCVACSIFAQNLYVNAGLFFLEYGQLDLAEELLVASRWLAPWSPHAAANLATLLRIKAKDILKQGGGKDKILRLLLASRDEYVNALNLRPNFETYLSSLKQVDDWLSSMRVGKK
jgi:hypothetical protein